MLAQNPMLSYKVPILYTSFEGILWLHFAGGVNGGAVFKICFVTFLPGRSAHAVNASDLYEELVVEIRYM